MRDTAASFPGPLFFERNRVSRVYRGGSLFHGFFGDPAEDGLLPEEWVASAVRAQNPRGEEEGVSLVKGTGEPFDRLLRSHRQALIGDRLSFDLLVKVLHSAVRLPVQVHPDKEFARRHFGSAHGKTEMWLVLATQGEARIYLGFRQGVTRRDLAESIRASETDREAGARLLNEVPVGAGDVFLIPGGLAHTIGAGCLILEAEEPTDLMIQAEAWCADYHLAPAERTMGLDEEIALGCFDLEVLVGERAVAAARRRPRTIAAPARVTGEVLIGPEDTPDFSVNRWRLQGGTILLGGSPAVYVATGGTGSVSSAAGTRGIARGDYFFLPACARGAAVTGVLELIECLPPPS